MPPVTLLSHGASFAVQSLVAGWTRWVLGAPLAGAQLCGVPRRGSLLCGAVLALRRGDVMSSAKPLLPAALFGWCSRR